jgi:hypothetical protein
MPLTLVATAGASNANTYVTLADADTYHESHYYASTWTAASDANQNIALVWATRLLDATYDWVGTIASDTQSLRWPRAAAYDRDGRLLANDEIPTELEYATAELARLLLASDRTAPESTDLAMRRVKAGTIEVEYLNGSTKAAETIPDAVYDLIRHLVLSRTNAGAITMRRG